MKRTARKQMGSSINARLAGDGGKRHRDKELDMREAKTGGENTKRRRRHNTSIAHKCLSFSSGFVQNKLKEHKTSDKSTHRCQRFFPGRLGGFGVNQ